MAHLLTLIKMALLAVGGALFSPLLLVVMVLVFYQYKRIQDIEIKMLGKPKITILENMVRAMVLGLLGGMVGTVIIMILGITIEPKDFMYLLPVAILLMLINVRYLCFSYGGGLLSLTSLIFGFPNINVSSVMAIVGILHLVESVLIWMDGHHHPMAIYVEDERYGVIGGFMLQRFWPIPFVILMLATGPVEGGQVLALPDWWPIFKNQMGMMDGAQVSLTMGTVVAALGYGDMTLSCLPKKKTRIAALRLFVYSTVVLFLSILSTLHPFFLWVVALAGPLGHEALIIYGQKEEKRGTPIFRQHKRGVTVLDTQRDSVGEKIGLMAGDVILGINGVQADLKEDILHVLRQCPTYLWLEVMAPSGQIRTLEHQNYQRGINSLGVLMVTQDTSVIFHTHTSVSIIKKWMNKLRKIING